ncbi:MAG: ATP-binding cassette domain-containing protein [Candidatus Latescibacteria bacterium]|nr:ATP-binding cassette domain-containing protein [bacterium]MBD3423640.1 ATP-binding cassette domain-containing protein [Candidatus Latescibacterota bacterium]
MLEIRNVTKRYDGTTAVDDLSLVVEPGGIYGLLGPNGAGKSTTIRMIMGIIEPDEGEMKLFDSPFSEKVKERIGYLPEERGLYRKMKVLDHLVFLGEIKGVSSNVARERAAEWLERVELSEWADRNVEALSKGMQQKVQFISTILHNPQLVILDEPFTGLDPINTQLLKDIVEEMKDSGRTVVLSTHLMDQVEKLCERICLINKGQKVIEGKLSDIKREFGKNVITIRYSGDRSVLENDSRVVSVRSFGQELSVTLAEGSNPGDIIRLALEHGEVEKFEVGEVSLHDIFIAKVREGEVSGDEDI